MAGIGAIGFLSPWLLAGLLALPVLWWLLRAVPPAAIRRRFPAVTLLLGLKDAQSTPAKTPWWLLALRMMALAAAIVGFAGPVLNPERGEPSRAPLLVLADASWASAPDWADRQARISRALADAARAGRPVAVIALSAPLKKAAGLAFRGAGDWMDGIASLSPTPWEPNYRAFGDWLNGQPDRRFDTLWLSDGLDRNGRQALAAELERAGTVRVVETGKVVRALGPAVFRDGKIVVRALRSAAAKGQGTDRPRITAYGPDPAGVMRPLASASAVFDPKATSQDVTFDIPNELRNRIQRFSLAGPRSAGAVVLADDGLKRRKIALFAGDRAREGQELLSALYYLKRALAPSSDLIEAPMRDSLLANPDVVILADVARMNKRETAALKKWVEKGGLLVRFAGPRLAANSQQRNDADPLLPVRLRAGGRDVGGAMSWGSPRALKAVEKGSPFFGLAIPGDVTVSSQVLAEPDPTLAERTIASLQDGTPLVTTAPLGKGRIVLFHVTANAEWSNLPLSGLFVKMLGRLAVFSARTAPGGHDLDGQAWQPEKVMTGFGDLVSAEDRVAVAGKTLAAAVIGPDLPPGIYANGTRRIAVNAIAAGRVLSAAVWPQTVVLEGMTKAREKPLKGVLLALALGLMLVDILATLWLGGRLRGPRNGALAGLALALFLPLPQARAASDMALRATRNTVLAYVITGDARLDRESEAGLYGLSQVLAERTAVEPADPIGIDLEKDDLAFFPLIYWPVSKDQPRPSDAAYDKLNTYLKKGGMILFDTRDANLGQFGASTENGKRLQALAAPLDIPALEPIPPDHVLTRSFYLLQDFPGRYAQSDVWVEAAPPDATRAKGMPFRNLNDGVSPVVIGGNDWAAAWALSRQGVPLFPVGRGGYAAERQREMAYRFGINLVMYVLTGNYKSDQVHVPALLERLGQ